MGLFLAWLVILSILLSTVIKNFGDPIEPAEHVTLLGRTSDMFALFPCVISLLQHYENGTFKAVRVDYRDLGDYYDPSVGNNSWEYYFEPIVIGNQNQPTVEYSYLFAGEIVHFTNSREYNAYIIDKYIKLKPHVQKKKDDFIASHFSDRFIIGVHYRGTDKLSQEADRVPYNDVANAISEHIYLHGVNNCRIFIASDEPEFFDYCEKVFPNMVVAYSRDKKTRGSYLAGETAVLDCVLLSECDVLIRTDSNLSLASTFFNPNIPVIELSQRRTPYDIYLNGYLLDPYSYNKFPISRVQDLIRSIELHWVNIEWFRFHN